jgi:hypothetical protein
MSISGEKKNEKICEGKLTEITFWLGARNSYVLFLKLPGGSEETS